MIDHCTVIAFEGQGRGSRFSSTVGKNAQVLLQSDLFDTCTTIKKKQRNLRHRHK